MKNADKSAFGELKQVGEIAVKEGGLTKREYFVVKAMKGIMANPNAQPTTNDHFTYIAQDAIKIADTLLLELEKEPKQ